MEFAKGLIEILFSPVLIMLLLLIIGTVATLVRPRSKWGKALLATGCLLMLIFLCTPLADILLANLEQRFPPLLQPQIAAPMQNIVVLSGYGEDWPHLPITSALTASTICRMVEGLRLYRLLPGSKITLSGGTLREGFQPVSAMMAAFMRAMGVPTEDLQMETRSTTTYENMLETKKLLGHAPFILVTSAAHLKRAVAMARNLDMRVIPAPACIRTLGAYPPGMTWKGWLQAALQGFEWPTPQRLIDLQSVYHEHLGYLWYKIRGSTRGVFSIAWIKKRNKRPSIHQNHRWSFRRIASCTPRWVSVEGAMASPPSPRSSAS